MNTKNTHDFETYLMKELKNPEFKKYYEEFGKQLEIAYEIQKLRKARRMSQEELARRIGTKQSNVARMERGEQNFTTETLWKVARAFDRDLKIQFVK